MGCPPCTLSMIKSFTSFVSFYYNKELSSYNVLIFKLVTIIAKCPKTCSKLCIVIILRRTMSKSALDTCKKPQVKAYCYFAVVETVYNKNPKCLISC